MASGFDLESVLGALGAGQQATQGYMGGMSGAAGLEKQALRDEGEAIGRQAEAAKVVKAQESAGLLQAQEQSRRAATSLGTNMSDASQVVTMLGQTMRDSYANLRAQTAKVAKINAGATLSNPLGLIYDIIAGDEARANLQGAQDQFDLAAKTLQSLNQATQQTAATNKAIAETKSEASNQAELEFIDAQTQVALAQNRQKLAGVDTRLFAALDSMNARQVSMAVQGYGLVAQEEQRQWQRAMREADLELRSDAKKEATATLELYNAGLAALGHNRQVDAASMKLESQVNRKQFDFVLSAGLSAMNGTGVKYGQAPLDALGNIQQFRIDLPPAQTQLAKSLSMQLSQGLNPASLVQAGLAKDQADAMMKLSDKKNLPQLQSAYLSQVGAMQLNSIDIRNDGNIYAPPPLDSLKGKAELNNNPFLRDYLLPTVEAGGNIKWDPSAMIKQGAETVMAGNHTSAEVAEGMAWIANQFMLMNDTTKNYRGFGLPTMSEFGKFYSPLSIDPGGFTSNINANIDLRDPVQVTAMLQRVIAATPGKTFSDRLQKLISNENSVISNALNRNQLFPMPGMRIVPGGPNQMVR